MSDKSSQAMEQSTCIVCGCKCEIELGPMDVQMRDLVLKMGLVKCSLCPACRAFRDQGYIALVECDPEKSGNPKTGQRLMPEEVHRTGLIIRVDEETFAAVFHMPALSRMPCVYVPPGVIQRLIRPNLH